MSKRARILVVDDDPLFRSLIASLLRRDYLVSLAGDGAEGFYQALERAPDLAVIDIQMPNWDGLKTLKAFRSHPSLSHVKTVVLTSDASKETVLAAIEAGAGDYVIKTSFSRDGFLQKLARLLPEPPDAPVAEAAADSAPPPESDAPQWQGACAMASATNGSATHLRDRDAQSDEASRLQTILDDWE